MASHLIFSSPASFYCLCWLTPSGYWKPFRVRSSGSSPVQLYYGSEIYSELIKIRKKIPDKEIKAFVWSTSSKNRQMLAF